MTSCLDFYAGFEGEGEIRFSLHTLDGVEKERIRIWEGYFDSLMKLLKPGENGWDGLALPYHLSTGWYEQEHWQVDDPRFVLKQWTAMETSTLAAPLPAVHGAVRQLLAAGADSHQAYLVRISRS